MRTRKRWVVALVALVAVGVVAAVVAGRSGVPQGPLTDGGGGGGISGPGYVGRTASSGALIVQNTADHAVVLDRVELVGLPDGVSRGGYVVPFPLPRQLRGLFLLKPTYRVPAYGRVLPGVTIPPHSKAWIVVALKARRGRVAWTHEDLVYHDDDTTYRRHVSIAGAVCAPYNKYLDGSCRIPDS